MRFPNHELVPELTPKPWWRDLPAETITLSEADWTATWEDSLLEVFEAKMDNMVKFAAKTIDNIMFWEPARDAYENGGCRQ